MANYDVARKGLLQAIKDYGDIQADNAKLRSGLLMNQIKQKENFLFQHQQKQMEQKQQEETFNRIQQQFGEGPYQARPSSMNVGGVNYSFSNPEDEKKRNLQEEREDRISKNMQFANATKLRQEFINRPEVKEYVNINTQVRSMDSLLKKAKEGNIQNKVALDQGLITMYNKLTDPNSVVRESEYARTPENLPLLNRLTGAIQKVQQGGAGLTDSDREALVWGAKVIANERGKTYNDTLQGYLELAGMNAIDSNLVTRGLEEHKDYSINNSKQSYKVGDILEFNGKKLRVIGGDMTDPDVEEVK